MTRPHRPGPLRVGVVGYGRFGRLQASLVDEHPEAVLTAVVDPSPDARAAAHRAHPSARVHQDVEELVGDPPDALLVVSPEDTHASISRVALGAGVHVLSEKPLATSVSEARELVELSREAGVVYQAGYLLRFEPRHRLLWDRIQGRGGLGEVRTMRAKRNVSRSWFEAYGMRIHPVYETLVHDIDLAVWLTGRRCRRVTAWSRSFLGESTPETVVLVLEFAGGALATLQTCWLVPEGAPANILDWEGSGVIDADLEVMCLEGSASLRTYEPSLTLTTSEGTYMPDTAFWPVTGGRVGGALREEVWDFIEAARRGGGSGVASIDDALHVQEIAEASVRAAELGTAVEIPPEP